jgi:hypothetical protein
MRFVKTDKDEFLGRRQPWPRSPSRCPGSAPIWKSSRTAIGTAMAARRCAWMAGGRLDRVGGLWSYGRQGPGLRLCQARRRRTRNQLEVLHERDMASARVLGEPAYDPAKPPAAHRCTGMRSRAMSAAPDTMRAMVLSGHGLDAESRLGAA